MEVQKTEKPNYGLKKNELSEFLINIDSCFGDKKFSIGKSSLAFELRQEKADAFFNQNGLDDFDEKLKQLTQYLSEVDDNVLSQEVKDKLQQVESELNIGSQQQDVKMFISVLTEQNLLLHSVEDVNGKPIEAICSRKDFQEPVFNGYSFKLGDLVTIKVPCDSELPATGIVSGSSPILTRCHHMNHEDAVNYLEYLKDQEKLFEKIERTSPLWECLVVRSGQILEDQDFFCLGKLLKVLEVLLRATTAGEKQNIMKFVAEGSLFAVNSDGSLWKYINSDQFDISTRHFEDISCLLQYVAEEFPNYGNRILTIIETMKTNNNDSLENIYNLLMNTSKKLVKSIPVLDEDTESLVRKKEESGADYWKRELNKIEAMKRDNGDSLEHIVDLLINKSRKLVLLVPGVSEDIESLHWRDQPLVPTQKELYIKSTKLTLKIKFSLF